MTPLKQEYKELYALELNRRLEMNKAIEQPIALVTAFGVVLFFVFSGIEKPVSCVHIVEMCIGAIATTLIVYAIYSIVRLTYNHEYAFVPTPIELENYKTELQSYHDGESQLTPEQIDDKVLSYIYAKYIESAHHNARINVLRSGHLHRAKKALVYALPLVLTLGAIRVGLAILGLFQ